jgi:hypothetical protein
MIGDVSAYLNCDICNSTKQAGVLPNSQPPARGTRPLQVNGNCPPMVNR